MFNRRIATSFLSIAMVLTIVGTATYAFFNDTATAANNTFATGNADLQIAEDVNGSAGNFTNNITGPTFADMFPGQSKTVQFWLKNNSASAISLDLTADVSAINPSGDGDQTIDNELLVSWTCDTDFDNSLSNNTPTSEFSPRAWLDGGNATLGNLPQGQQMFCSMTGRLPESSDETVANQSVSFDVDYDAQQAP